VSFKKPKFQLSLLHPPFQNPKQKTLPLRNHTHTQRPKSQRERERVNRESSKMSTLRKRRPRDHQEPNKNTKPNEEINNNEHHETPKISVYEQTREERIKENLERMQRLGLMDLSLKLKACTAPPKRTPRTSPSSTKHPTPFLPRGPLRRSSRCL
jgi:hypothetical protein